MADHIKKKLLKITVMPQFHFPIQDEPGAFRGGAGSGHGGNRYLTDWR